MSWLFSTFYWYFFLLILGLIFLPITRRFFTSFVDYGYSFGKTIAILVLSYLAFVLGILKLAPFTQISLFILIGLFAVTSIFFIRKFPFKIPNSVFKILIFEELLFLASIIFLAYVRGQEPSIHSLEKFMDFGFINSILRAKYFPPADIWLSGNSLNYYYFGHITGAFLIKLTGTKPSIGYNLILAAIFAQGMTLAFSLTANIINSIKKINLRKLIAFGLLGSFIINLTGNLHTIYLFTTGYPGDHPIPFWQIFSGFHPERYWYPNATRFVPFTIHEFPSYSYVVADLHGHVFDIPFVLLTLALLFKLFLSVKQKVFSFQFSVFSENLKFQITNSILYVIPLGFLVAVHYMTNAFDGPIYLLLSLIIFFIMFGLSTQFILSSIFLLLSSILFALPFSLNFSPFVSGIGVNCSPQFFVNLHKFGPFLFEENKCQGSPLWMLFVLWGFFWICFAIFLKIAAKAPKKINQFILILFSLGTLFVFIPEFFYIKDIYPAHFRANTMFKLGYQAFIMMGVASTMVAFQIHELKNKLKIGCKLIFLLSFSLIFIYPFYAFTSYYGNLQKKPDLEGANWLNNELLSDKEIIDYLNTQIKGQPVILEAQGDSYTDYERISAFTGLPTVAGWWVHEWLWRGTPDAVGQRIPDVATLYESSDLNQTNRLIKKYNIKYIIVSSLEREKYKNLKKDKFNKVGRKIFQSLDKLGALYRAN